MLLSKTEKAKSTERFETVLAISLLLVNKYEISSPKTRHIMKKNVPTMSEFPEMTRIENFAAFASPLPNSLETRTLHTQRIVRNS